MRVACGERNGSFSMKGILIEVLGSTLWESPGRSPLMEDTVFLFRNGLIPIPLMILVRFFYHIFQTKLGYLSRIFTVL